MPSIIGLIPARAGSKRIPNKNIKKLLGHPLIAYTIASAQASGIFNRIVVSTDSEETRDIALYYGAEVPFLRPAELATSLSPDIEWLKHAFKELNESFDCFSILRPTSPFRMPETIIRAWERFLELSDKYNIDSIRAVELCHEHPGKMWKIKGELMEPFIEQSGMEVAWHARQYQDLPKVYIQNSSLEIAWTRVIWETNSREGKIIAPFITENNEGFALDYPHEWVLAEMMVKDSQLKIPKIKKPPYKNQ